MTPEQRKAHLILQGQTLLDEWVEFCRLWNLPYTSPTQCYRVWESAVLAEFGGSVKIAWGIEIGGRALDSTLSNGEFYKFIRGFID